MTKQLGPLIHQPLWWSVMVILILSLLLDKSPVSICPKFNESAQFTNALIVWVVPCQMVSAVVVKMEARSTFVVPKIPLVSPPIHLLVSTILLLILSSVLMQLVLAIITALMRECWHVAKVAILAARLAPDAKWPQAENRFVKRCWMPRRKKNLKKNKDACSRSANLKLALRIFDLIVWSVGWLVDRLGECVLPESRCEDWNK